MNRSGVKYFRAVEVRFRSVVLASYVYCEAKTGVSGSMAAKVVWIESMTPAACAASCPSPNACASTMIRCFSSTVAKPFYPQITPSALGILALSLSVMLLFTGLPRLPQASAGR